MSCLHSIATSAPLYGASWSAYGILFTASIPPGGETTTITSLGFHVDAAEIGELLNYEVHTLVGHYADPNRTGGGGGGLPLDSTWDYRVENSTQWEKVAEGALGPSDLAIWPPPSENFPANTGRVASYFRIPSDRFAATSIDVGEVRSFYVAVKEAGALLNSPVENWEDFLDEQDVEYCGDDSGSTVCIDGDGVDGKPIIHVGECVVSYPFPTSPYLYRPAKFMGGIYYLSECPSVPPSAAPSITALPTRSSSPSISPTSAESARPSRSSTPSSPPTSSHPPTARFRIVDAGRDGCHGAITTDRDYGTFGNVTSSSYGIVFPIRSNEGDGDGVRITSLGFHVDFSAMPPLLDGGGDDDGDDAIVVNYEVYALIEAGPYADPDRNNWGEPQSFDHRGNFTLWRRIATGTIREDDLPSSSRYDGGGGDYFQIPFATFEPTFVPPNSTIRSFYLTLDSAALVYADPERKGGLGGVQKDDDFRKNYDDDDDATQHPPILLRGEGVVGYPFRAVDFLYSPRRFVGRVFYEYECPTESPSAAPSLDPSGMPSFPPSDGPSNLPSFEPSASPSSSPSSLPSNMPSSGPSETPTSMPSTSPSSTPSVGPTGIPSTMPSILPSATVSPTHVHYPSDSPTRTPSPSGGPSSQPTVSAQPSTSSGPSSRPSSRPSRRPSAPLTRPVLPPLSSSTCFPSPALGLVLFLQLISLLGLR